MNHSTASFDYAQDRLMASPGSWIWMEISIKDLMHLLARLAGFKGGFVWDTRAGLVVCAVGKASQ